MKVTSRSRLVTFYHFKIVLWFFNVHQIQYIRTDGSLLASKWGRIPP